MTVISRNRICRRLSPKGFAITAIGLTLLLCLYYTSISSDVQRNLRQTPSENDAIQKDAQASGLKWPVRQIFRKRNLEKCPRLVSAEADISTLEIFKDFDFQPSWMRSKEYWDKIFEDRYERQKMDPERPPLKVIIVPHSHNDPGWLKTFENYFHFSSRQIMNNMVAKLQEYKNLTFIWSEISYLNAWWEEAHPSKQRALRDLVHSGRLEITTGGWVMTDEANVHLYAMVDQLIEGHQWLWTNLGIKPKSGWSVDPFGHGSTVPYLLSASGFRGTVIQRIHYAWKQWLALKQYGDFRWVPAWSPSDQQSSLLTHNQPFDIYSIKHSCGPHPYVCLNFDFRKVQGEYTEYSLKAQAITSKNVKEKAELLLEQYARTGSLFPHNVVLTPLGDDFRYNVREEWDQQYTNYVKLINYINAHKDQYKAEVAFGTPTMYFDEISKRFDQYPTLKGDFYVYSDIFSEGRPAYWSGYFTTRPFLKILDRQLEHSTRSAEILYTVALNYAKQQKSSSYSKILEKDYEKLIRSRRNLGLFQHHDAITGTSKSFVMKDYGIRLFEALRDTTNIRQHALQSLLFPNLPIKKDQNLVLSDVERDSFDKIPNKTNIQIAPKQSRKILLFNPLSYPQEHVIVLTVNTTNVKVTDHNGSDVLYQINPILEANGNKYWVEPSEYELIFIAKLEELSVTSFNLVHTDDASDKLGILYCKRCFKKNATSPDGTRFEAPFTIRDIPVGDIQLENQKMKILFSGSTGFMKTVTRKHKPKVMQCKIWFAAYRSAQFHSGAYLFMPDPNERDYEKDVLLQYKEQMSVIITTGPVSTEILTIYNPFLVHKVTIYLVENSTLANAIQIENTVDFENPPKNRETELFMRIISDVQNGDPPEFYTDLNNFNMQKRVKVERIGIEGNYFPVTSMAYIQDESVRLSLLTNHAQGAASWQPGYLEVMLDRRTLYDDSRGMGEGLVDSRRTTSKYWLLVEDVSKVRLENGGQKRFDGVEDTFEKGDVIRSFNVPTTANEPTKQEPFPMASLYATHLSNALNYPAEIYIVDSEYQSSVNDSIKLLNKPFPCDVLLLNVRTQPDAVYSQFPSNSALVVLHRQGYDCSINTNYTCDVHNFEKDNYFKILTVKEVELKSLTGLDSIHYFESLGDVYIEPMSLKTLNVTFG
ncbi:alpha-mannosidase 2 [Cylas formicarius]|uniref:alpha-mannosidase 2 n=1 Tax=Cylas formicarius TaxID=197179 RepID=UPI0029586C41|nr:alpha-mannosidase 2 [Cylas formicarius]